MVALGDPSVGRGCVDGEVIDGVDSPMQPSSTLTPINAAWAIAEPVGIEVPDVSEEDALLMFMGFDGEEMPVESVGFTTDGEEEGSDVPASNSLAD